MIPVPAEPSAWAGDPSRGWGELGGRSILRHPNLYLTGASAGLRVGAKEKKAFGKIIHLLQTVYSCESEYWDQALCLEKCKLSISTFLMSSCAGDCQIWLYFIGICYCAFLLGEKRELISASCRGCRESLPLQHPGFNVNVVFPMDGLNCRSCSPRGTAAARCPAQGPCAAVKVMLMSRLVFSICGKP